MEKTNKIGIFLNKNHTNYYNYGMFLSRQTAAFKNIYLYGFDNTTKLCDIPRYNTNIYLNRYCYIRIDKIQEILCENLYLLPSLAKPAIVVDNTSLNIVQNNSLIVNLLSFWQTKKYTNINKYSHLRNLGDIKLPITEALFVCFDDQSASFIDELKSFHDNKKDVLYNNKIYQIGYEDLFFEKNKIIAVLSKRVKVIWNRKSKKWIKYNPKGT